MKLFTKSSQGGKNQSRSLAFLLLIALIPFGELIHQIAERDYIQAVVIFSWLLALFLLPVFLFRKNLKVYLLILSPVYLLIPLNLFYALFFNADVMSSDLTVLFLNTNRFEMMELLKHYYVGLILTWIIYLAALIFLYKKCPNVVAPKVAYYISGVSLIVLLVFPFFDVKRFDIPYSDIARTNINNNFPISIIKGIKRVIVQKRLSTSSKPYRDAFKFGAKQDTSIHDKQVVILVVGESSRYDHWGINGYARNTSPHLSKRTNLLTFNNVTAGAYLTEQAVPLILTGVGASNFDEHVKRKSIFGVFEEAGFNTFWISDQPGDTGNIGVHASEAQQQHSMMQDKTHDKDMYMLDTLKNIIKQPGNKKFIIIHTMGSHYDYADRYPANFEVFKPSNTTVKTRISDLEAKNILINTYDNTIVYSDAMVDSVISIANKLNVVSTVTYLSDHGEDMLDNAKHYSFHMNGSPPSRYIAHIPMFVWYSPKLQQQFPGKISNLVLHKSAKISSENIIYTLSSLLGINYPKLDPAKDVTSGSYKDNQQAVMGEGQVIYLYSHL